MLPPILEHVAALLKLVHLTEHLFWNAVLVSPRQKVTPILISLPLEPHAAHQATGPRSKLFQVEVGSDKRGAATVVWKTLARWCHAAALGEEPRKVFAELRQIRLVDVVLPTRNGLELRKRCVSRPTEHQAILLQRLGLSLPIHLEVVGL